MGKYGDHYSKQCRARKEPMAEAEEAECFEEGCGWAGPITDAISPEHDPDDLLCPACRARLIW